MSPGHGALFARLPRSLELEVCGLLGWRDLLILLRVSSHWKTRLAWFLRSPYHRGPLNFQWTNRYTDEPGYMAFMDEVNIRDLSIPFVLDSKTSNLLLKRVLLRAHDTIQTLRLEQSLICSRLNQFLTPFHLGKLSSLLVHIDDHSSFDEVDAVALVTLLTTHYATLTEVRLYTTFQSDIAELLCRHVVEVGFPMLQTLHLSIPAPSTMVEQFAKAYGSTLTQARFIVIPTVRDTLVDPLTFLKQCERFTLLTSLDVRFVYSNDSRLISVKPSPPRSVTWSVPPSLSQLDVMSFVPHWGFAPRVVSTSLQRLSLHNFDPHILGTLAVDCPRLIHLSLLDPFFIGDHSTIITLVDSTPTMMSVASSSTLPLCTLITEDPGPGEPLIPTLLLHCGTFYAMLREMEIDYRINPTISTCSLTRYFVDITSACPRLETIDIKFTENRRKRDSFVVVVTPSTTGSSTPKTTVRRGGHGHRSLLRSLRVTMTVDEFGDPAQPFQRRFFLDIDELVAFHGYEFPVTACPQRTDVYIDYRRVCVCVQELRVLKAPLCAKSIITMRRFLQSLTRLSTFELADVAIAFVTSDTDTHTTSSSSSLSSSLSRRPSSPTTVTPRASGGTAALTNLTIVEYTNRDRSSTRHGLWPMILTWFTSVRHLSLLLCCIGRDYQDVARGKIVVDTRTYHFDDRRGDNQSEISEFVRDWFGRLSGLLLQHGTKLESLALDFDRRAWAPGSWGQVGKTIMTECQRLMTTHQHLDTLTVAEQRFMPQQTWTRLVGPPGKATKHCHQV